ncbi:lipopolysaccharide assembly protein LapB [Caulobacter sp. S45]|uniref:tetratricopeptide repeat protein n=1 Tax=Caulobacter sp. S45 TaxID=1641861 RepID=UPI001575243E|nr:endoglucanase [Caulobacter sp. S45]
MRSRPAISLAVSASLALGSGATAPAAWADAAAQPAPETPGGVSVKVGQADAFSRIEFDGVQPRSARRDGQDLVLQFGHVAAPNLSLLRVDPPRYLKTASTRATADGMELRLTLAQGVQAKVGRADGGAYVNLSPGASPAAPADQTPDRKVDPVPASGVVKAHAELQHGLLSLRFDWRAPVGAAVFRRGDAIWVVFDAHARLDLGEAPGGLPQARRIEPVSAPNVTALRILAPVGVVASATAQGASWTIALGPATGAPPSPLSVKPEAGGLAAQLAGATGVFWLDDPAVGDRLAVVTALGPAKGVPAPRRLVDANVLASTQGLALLPLASDLTVVSDGDVVRIGRPSGLQLSVGVQAPLVVSTPLSLPQPTALPALIDFDGWSKTGQGGFLVRYEALLQGASDEGIHGKDAPLLARFGFARFLVGSQMAFEAIGVLDLLAKTNPQVTATPEFRGLRGAARAMAGRFKDAQADFSSPALSSDPSSALWRGYVASRLGDAAGARQAFVEGRGVLDRFSPEWRERFLQAQGEAALTAGDLGAARNTLQLAQVLKPQGVEGDRLSLDLARLAEAAGQPDAALPLFATAEASPYGGVSAPALLYATELQQAHDRIAPAEAAAVLASIRFRWRGDGTELEAARALGRLYIAQGRYRDALEALRASQTASATLPAAAGVQGDLGSAFRSLFLDGGADGLPPIQALALFFDFKDLTPVGADGDTMVRKLARRLVDVDLLDQAAELLKYQADNRLDGVARGEVDTDLALIQVMNRQPEAALDALNASRTTLLPTDLQSRRRVIQSRALSALGRYDDALEILDADKSADAQAARAEALWRRRDWPRAGKAMEVALGDRFKSAAPLSELEQAELLRAAIAYSLAGDEAGLGRLRTRYGQQAETARDAALLKVALAGPQSGFSAPAYGAAAPDADAFATWVSAMKSRLMASGLAKA